MNQLAKVISELLRWDPEQRLSANDAGVKLGMLLDTSTGLLTGSYHVLSLALAALLLMPVFFLLTHTPLIEDDDTKGAVALAIFLVLLAACHTFLGRIRVRAREWRVWGLEPWEEVFTLPVMATAAFALSRPDNPPILEWYSVVPALMCEGLSLAAFAVSCLLLNSTALREMAMPGMQQPPPSAEPLLSPPPLASELVMWPILWRLTYGRYSLRLAAILAVLYAGYPITLPGLPHSYVPSLLVLLVTIAVGVYAVRRDLVREMRLLVQTSRWHAAEDRRLALRV